MTLTDSLLHVIAVKDSLLEAAATRAIHVGLPTQQVAVSPSRDWFDWLQLLGALLVAPTAALLAAWVGARIGGREATRATLTALREEMDVERRHRIALLDRCIARTLEQIKRVPDRFAEQDQTHPFSLPRLRDVAALWTSYERVSNHAGLYPDQTLIGDLERFFQDVRIVAEQAIHVEEVLEAFREKLEPPARGEEANYFTKERRAAESARQGTLATFQEWPKRATAFLERHDEAMRGRKTADA